MEQAVPTKRTKRNEKIIKLHFTKCSDTPLLRDLELYGKALGRRLLELLSGRNEGLMIPQ